MVKKIQFDANLIGSKLQKWCCNKIASYNKAKSYVGGAEIMEPRLSPIESLQLQSIKNY